MDLLGVAYRYPMEVLRLTLRMTAVFESGVGDYAVATNEPGRVVYVVKPTRFEPSLDELRRQFKQPINRRMAAMIDTGVSDILNDFMEGVDKEAGYTNLMQRDQ